MIITVVKLQPNLVNLGTVVNYLNVNDTVFFFKTIL